MYEIKDYTYNQAMKYGVIVLPSKKKNKKIDVYDKNDNYITSIGARGYLDYGTILKNNGLEYADYRRELFYKRHGLYKKGTRGWYSSYILW